LIHCRRAQVTCCNKRLPTYERGGQKGLKPQAEYDELLRSYAETLRSKKKIQQYIATSGQFQALPTEGSKYEKLGLLDLVANKHKVRPVAMMLDDAQKPTIDIVSDPRDRKHL